MLPSLPPAVTLLGPAAQQASREVLPLLACRVRAGFPSTAGNHLDTDIDLNAHVVK